MRTNESLGKTAYAAYTEAVGGTTWDDKPMPMWDELNDRQRDGWIAAAVAVGFAGEQS